MMKMTVMNRVIVHIVFFVIACRTLPAQADKQFQFGELVNVKFVRPFHTEKGYPLDPVWLGYDFEIQDLTTGEGWFPILTNFYQSFDDVILTKKTTSLTIGHVYQHRVRSVIEPARFIAMKGDTAIYAAGRSDWVLTETYVVVDSTMPVVPDTLYLKPMEPGPVFLEAK